jgi:hypothetical protein
MVYRQGVSANIQGRGLPRKILFHKGFLVFIDQVGFPAAFGITN